MKQLFSALLLNYYVKYSIIVTAILSIHAKHYNTNTNVLFELIGTFCISMIISFFVYKAYLNISKHSKHHFLLTMLFTSVFVAVLFFFMGFVQYFFKAEAGVTINEFYKVSILELFLREELNDLLFSAMGYSYFRLLDKEKEIVAEEKQQSIDLEKRDLLVKESELDSLNQKINPHFLFNSLNSIAGLVYEDKVKAKKMMHALKHFFKSVEINPSEIFATIDQEISIIKLYLDIEKIRFEERLTIKYNIDPSIKNVRIPKFLIQPLVENAIKHGISPYAKNGFINVDIREMDSLIRIQIKDSGVYKELKKPTGYGLKNISEKLNFIYKKNASLTVYSKNGTCIEIVIPKEV